MMDKIFKFEYLDIDLDLNTPDQLLEEIAKISENNGICEDNKKLITKIKERESLASTGFEGGIAIPHARFKEIKKSAVLFIRVKKGIEWKAMDGQLSDKFFCILVPENENVGDEHLKILSVLANKLLDKDFLELVNHETNKEVLYTELNNILDQNNMTQNEDEDLKEVKNQDFFVAVTACSFGLAHTYLAEQKLIKFAKENNFKIKVETHGARGDKNVINEDDLKRAKGVLIAVDKDLNLKHLKHNNIYRTRTIDVIKNTEKCFDILNGKIKINRSKKEIEDFFKVKLFQTSSFSVGKTYNFIRYFALVTAMFVFISQIYPSKFVSQSLSILELSSLIGIPLFTGFIIFGFTKFELGASSVGVSLILITIYKNLFTENDSIQSIGIIGAIVISALAVFYLKLMIFSNRVIFKNDKVLNGGLKFIFQTSLVILVLIISFFTFDYFNILNSFIIHNIIDWDTKFWWFRMIVATLFFGLMVTDMGGPINKWTIIFSGIFFIDSFSSCPTNPWMTPITAQGIAISTPGIAIWFRGLLLRNKINKDEKDLSNSAGIQGFKGISEGSLWTIEKYGWKAFVSNYILALYCGFIIGFFHIKTFGGYNNVLGSIFGFSTDNVLYTVGLGVPSFNIGFLILTTTSPIFGGIISLAFLKNKKNGSKIV